MLPKVSIIIPVYNGGDYLGEAIDSALNQTYQNCEVIVVNDGSTDDTEQVARSYGDRIRYFKKENGGVSSALNAGIKNMEGEYFSWLSHDDIYYPWKIECQIEMLMKGKDKHAPVYSSWNSLVMPEGTVEPVLPDYRFSKEDYQNEILPVLFGLINGCTVLLHKSHFERVGLFDETLLTAQDYEMWFRIFRRRKAIYINSPLIKYRSHAAQGSITISEFSQNCQDIQLKMIKQITKEEIEVIFGGYYKFYFDMLRMADLNRWTQVMQQMLDEFGKTLEPAHKVPTRHEVVLYCAGRNGRRLKEELYFRGVDVEWFSDGNPALWNTKIDGVQVVPLNTLSKDICIIVTKDNPEEVVSMLYEQGYKNVRTYEKMSMELHKSLPVKERVLDHYMRLQKSVSEELRNERI